MTFPGGLIAIAFIQFFVCIMLPVFYLIYYVFKKDFSLLVMLFGIVAFIVFDIIVTGLLLRLLAVNASRLTTEAYAILYAVIIGVVKAVGIWIVMMILKPNRSLTVPVSFALGYSLIDMFLRKSAQSFTVFTQGMTVNRNGFEEVVASVDLAKQDAMRESLIELSQTPASIFIWGLFQAACAFIATVCLTRLLWYSVDGGKINREPALFPLGILIAVVLELPLSFYNNGLLDGVAKGEIVYYVLTVLLLVGTILIARRHDEKETVSDSHLPLHKR